MSFAVGGCPGQIYACLPSIVDQDVQSLALAKERLCGLPDRIETFHIHVYESDLAAIGLRLDFIDNFLA